MSGYIAEYRRKTSAITDGLAALVRAVHPAFGAGGRNRADRLVATGSTTFDEPYHVARRFASLDHISGGRAGWNIVTTSNPDAALNFGLDDHMEHGERYARAREFYDVVTGLWDSFAETPSSAMWIAASISIRAKCMC